MKSEATAWKPQPQPLDAQVQSAPSLPHEAKPGKSAGVHARTAWQEAIGPLGRYPCPHCAQAFARAGYLELHLGRRHAERITPGEKTRFESVKQAELAMMHEIALHTKSALFALPIFLVWALTLVLLIELETNIAWMLMSTPGYAFFAALIYVMAYGYQSGGRESYHGRN